MVLVALILYVRMWELQIQASGRGHVQRCHHRGAPGRDEGRGAVHGAVH